jgi:N-acetyltransferase
LINKPSLPSGLFLRHLERRDQKDVRAVLDQWWGRPMGGFLPRPFFVHFRDTSFVIERDGELVAFLVGFLSQTCPDEAYIHAVAVAPAARGQGLAHLLYREFFDVADRHGRRRVRAITAPANKGSIAFHRHLGFTVEDSEAAGDEDCRVNFLLELGEQPPRAKPDPADAAALCAALAVPLVGARVALEPLGWHHEAGLGAAAAESDWSLMPIDGGSSPSAFGRWLAWVLQNAKEEPAAPLAVFRGDRAIGSTTYHAIHPAHRRLEIGMTWYARSEWRSGANVEAKQLMLEHAFALGLRRVAFKTDARNTRSRQALEALPAQFEGVFRKHMLVRGGETRDSAYYSVIDDDWPDVRANLKRRLARNTDRLMHETLGEVAER